MPPGGPAATGGQAHHPGQDTGRLVLAACRAFGLEAATAVVRGHQAGYNARSPELGDVVLGWSELENGPVWALPETAEDEARTIAAGL